MPEDEGGAVGLTRAGNGRQWYLLLGLISLLGFALRLYYIHVHKQHVVPFSDAYYYHAGANLLAEGRGFLDPVSATIFKRSLPGAIHPPGFIVALAVPSLFGFKSFFAHQVTAAILSTATIAVVGLVGRRIAGPRAGLVAATLAALYPNFFFSDALLLSETMVLLMGALTLLMVYRFWDQPSYGRAAALGIVCGLTALARSETVLLFALLIVPAALLLRHLEWRRRIALLAVAGAAAVCTLAPWAAYNLTRFEHPVFLSIGDQTLLAGNCQQTYYGDTIGYWSLACFSPDGPGRGETLTSQLIAQAASHRGDGSTAGLKYRKQALDYIGDHLRRTPFVVFAREGRTFGFYRPSQQLGLDQLAPRELWLSRIAATMYYAFVLAAVAGVVLLRRRAVPVFPMFALLASVVISVAVTIGETRYRALAEVPLVLCAAVAIEAALARLVRRRPQDIPEQELPARGPEDLGEKEGAVAAIAHE